MSQELWHGTCPACDATVTYDRWGEAFGCPDCGVRLEPVHECDYDAVLAEECCYDWLVVVR